MNPLVSIIIPTYNRSHLLGETLDSVINQEYANWECIIVDDGSCDYTEELLEFYCNIDSRIRLNKRPRNWIKGSNSSRNYGLSLSRGEFIQWLDSDDLISPEKIAAQVRLLCQNQDIEMSFCNWSSFFDQPLENKIQLKEDIYLKCTRPRELFDLLGDNEDFIPPHSYLVRRELILKAGGWNEYLLINQDGEFFSRILLAANAVSFSPEGMVYYRRNYGSDNISLYNSEDKVKDSIACLIMMEQAHKIKFKTDYLPYIENSKKQLFYYIQKAGYAKLTYKFEDLFDIHLKNYREELKRRKSLSRKLQRLKRFFEVKILGHE